MASPYSLLKKPRSPYNLGIEGLDNAQPDPQAEIQAAAQADPVAPPDAFSMQMGMTPVNKGSGMTNTRSRANTQTEQNTNSETEQDLNSQMNSSLHSTGQTNTDQNMRQGETVRDVKTGQTSKTGESDTNKTGQSRNVYDASGYNDRVNSALESPALKDQLAETENIKNLMSLIAQKKQHLNLSPLYNIANYLTKGQSGQYEAPADVSDKTKLLLAQAQKLIQDKRDITNEAMKNAQAQQVGKNTDLQSQLMTQSLMNSQAEQQRQADLMRSTQTAQTATKDQVQDQNKNQTINTSKDQTVNTNQNSTKDTSMAKDPSLARGGGDMLEFRKAKAFSDLVARDPLQKAIGKQQEMADISKAILSGDPAAQRNVPNAIGRLIIGNRPSNEEIRREGGDPSFVASVLQRAEILSKGSMTTANQKQYLDFLHDMDQVNRLFISAHADRLRNIGKQSFQRPDSEIDAQLNDSYLNQFAPPPSSGDRYEGEYNPKTGKQRGETPGLNTPKPGKATTPGGDPGMDEFLRTRGN